MAGAAAGGAMGRGLVQRGVRSGCGDAAGRGVSAVRVAVLMPAGRSSSPRSRRAGARAVAHAWRILRLLDALGAEARGEEADTVAGPLRVAAFRSAALHLLPPALERLTARYPGVEPQVRVVRELGPGTAGEVAEGRADLGIATIGTTSPVPARLIGDILLEEPYALVHPVGHPDPRSLPLVDWAENCSSYTREWWAGQDWIPRATVEAEDDGAVLSMVGSGLGMAIMPTLSLTGAPPSVQITSLGRGRPSRSVGYVTTPGPAGTSAVRALIRELRRFRTPPASSGDHRMEPGL
ncbi:LysR family transcriptional regulator substrate-binding protein [Streptomyces sp. NPDC058391]|uniref:LysR family transcriptional regulator substrate-binding protein n=1 Tax=Streptomyces sp. NPDC058391 TaxID=3346476 RepID=UPI003663BFCA